MGGLVRGRSIGCEQSVRTPSFSVSLQCCRMANFSFLPYYCICKRTFSFVGFAKMSYTGVLFGEPLDRSMGDVRRQTFNTGDGEGLFRERTTGCEHILSACRACLFSCSVVARSQNSIYHHRFLPYCVVL